MPREDILLSSWASSVSCHTGSGDEEQLPSSLLRPLDTDDNRHSKGGHLAKLKEEAINAEKAEAAATDKWADGCVWRGATPRNKLNAGA